MNSRVNYFKFSINPQEPNFFLNYWNSAHSLVSEHGWTTFKKEIGVIQNHEHDLSKLRVLNKKNLTGDTH